MAAWSTWLPSHGVPLPEINAYRQLEITAALNALGEVISEAITEGTAEPAN